jgi:hypothetical protein
MVQQLETDYLVVGAGAAGMAFADELVRHNHKVKLVIVDRRATPGGHWNDAYSFVRLHQPALFYGVNSLALGPGGTYLASGGDITTYYARVMENLQASGQVRFLSRCEYHGDGRVSSLEDPSIEYAVHVRAKTVDATYSDITVPSTTPPSYEVTEGVNLVPINGIATLERDWAHFTVIGSGKTGIDAVLHLLASGIPPDRITWIISNATWMMNRDSIRPDTFSTDYPRQVRCIAEGRDITDIYTRLEAGGHVFRLDPNIWPTRNRCATVNTEELHTIRQVSHVVRKGRVRRITPEEIILDEGEEPVGPDTLFVDCSANGLTRRPSRPVYEGKRITIQPVVLCQPVLSAAIVAMVETRVKRESSKNRYCIPIPHPTMPEDYLYGLAATASAMDRWSPRFIGWFFKSRLSVGHHQGFWANIVFGFRLERWRRAAVANIERLL